MYRPRRQRSFRDLLKSPSARGGWDMNALEAWLELVLETVQKEAYYSTYLALVVAWFAYMGIRGLASKETRGFGWRRGPALEREAVLAGGVWLSLAAVLGVVALFFKLT